MGRSGHGYKKEYFWQDKEKWGKLCHKMTHIGLNISTSWWWWWWWRRRRRRRRQVM